MSAFGGDAIQLTFEANLTDARRAYEQFIEDVSRRPVPIQFQAGGAGAAAGSSVYNAPGTGGAVNWTWGQGSPTGNAGFTPVSGPVAGGGGFGFAGGQIGGVASAAAGVRAAVAEVSAQAAAELEEVASAVRGAGGGGAAARGRAGGTLGGLASNRFLFAHALLSAGVLARGQQVGEEAAFHTSLSASPADYYANRARQVAASESGIYGGIAGWAWDRAAPLFGLEGPTSLRRGFEQAAQGERSEAFMRRLDTQNSVERLVRMAGPSSFERSQAEIRARAWGERTGLEGDIGDRERAIALVEQGGTEVAANDPRRLEIATLRARVRGVTQQEEYDLARGQRAAHLAAREVGLREPELLAAIEGREGVAEERGFTARLRGRELRAAEQGPEALDATRRINALDLAARAEENRERDRVRGAAAVSLQHLIGRDPLGSQLGDVAEQRRQALRQARTPAEANAVNTEFDLKAIYSRQAFGDVTFTQQAALNVQNARLGILTNPGLGTLQERGVQGEASDIYGGTLLQIRQALQQGRGSLVPSIRRGGQLQLESLQQQLLSNFHAEEADVRRTATQDPGESLNKIAATIQKLGDIPDTLDRIEGLLQDFDKTY
jgi:hypothetical protein